MLKLENQYVIAKKIYLENKDKSISWVAEQAGVNRKKLSLFLKEEGLYRGKKYTDEFLNECYELLQKGIGITQVARQLKCDRVSLSKALTEKGLYCPKNNFLNINKYKTDECILICKDYTDGMTMKGISIKYNVSENFVNNVLKCNNIKKKTSVRKYKINENYFKIIDTEEKAYWLGFLYADGYIGESSGVIELSLCHEDEEHLLKFKHCLESNSPIKRKIVNLKGKNYSSSRLCICNKNMIEDLISCGCVQNKSLVLNFPTFLEEELIHHFIRGYFDGDGSVGVYDGQLRFSLIGTKNLLNSCIHHMGLYSKKMQSQGKAYSISYHGNNIVTKIYNYLYENSSIYLNRKKLKFDAVIGQRLQKANND